MNPSLTLIGMLSVITVYSQQPCDYTISGHVASFDTKEALPSVALFLGSNTSHGTTTDYNGKFVIKGVCGDEQFVIVRYAGFDTDTVVLHFNNGKKQHLEIRLRQSKRLLEEVSISENRLKISPTQSVARLSASDILQSSGKPIGAILSQATGVSTLQTGPTIFKPVIQGLHSQRILIINNGVKLQGQQWGAEHGPEIDPYIASEITVVKGADVIQYGADAIGGAIILDPPSIHDAEKLGGEVYLLGTTNGRTGAFSSMLEGRVSASHHWKWRVQGTLKRGGDYHTPRYQLTNTGMKEYNLSAAIGYRDAGKSLDFFFSSFNTELGILQAAHTGGMSDLEYAITSHQEEKTPQINDKFSYKINNPKQQVNHHLGEIRAHYKLKNHWKVKMNYSLQLNKRKEYDIRRRAYADRPAMNLELTTHNLELSIDHKPIKRFTGTVGAGSSIKNNRNIKGTGVTPLIPQYDQANIGIFVSEKYVSDKWDAELGVRYDHQLLKIATFDEQGLLKKPKMRFDMFSFVAGFHYMLSNRWDFNIHIGNGQRPPHVSELFSQGLHHGTASIEYGMLRPQGQLLPQISEANINNEKSNKITASITYQTSTSSLQLTGYYNRINGYVFLRPTGLRQTIRGAFVTYQYDQTNIRMSGLDLNLSKDFSSKWSYLGKGSIIYAKDITNNDVVVNIPANRFENKLKYNFLSKKNKKPFLALALINVLKQHRNPKVLPISQIDNQPNVNRVFDFVDSPSAYHLLNFSAGITLPIKENTLDIVLSIENLTNKNYNDYMNRLRYFVSEIGRNFSIRLKYNFHAHD